MAALSGWNSDITVNVVNNINKTNNIKAPMKETQFNNSEDFDGLKIVLLDIWNEWEHQRNICCLSQYDFAKHLLNYHSSFCEKLITGNSNSITW